MIKSNQLGTTKIILKPPGRKLKFFEIYILLNRKSKLNSSLNALRATTPL